MSSDARRHTSTAECFRQPLPPMRWAALAQWREILPCLEPRAHRLAPIAEIWLPALLNELSSRLDTPLSVQDDGPVRTITALGFVHYLIDRQARTVACRLLATGVPIPIGPERFDVVSAWTHFGWLKPLLSELPAMRLATTLLPEAGHGRLTAWLTTTLEPMLRRDPRLHQLRRELRQALCFDADLFRLALRSRNVQEPNALLARLLMAVWQYEAHLRVVEKDAPRLLSLAFRVRDELAKGPACESVKRLKDLLSEAGLTDAGWRYLLKHGHKPLWLLGGGNLIAEEVAALAQALTRAGNAPPPPPALRAAWAPTFLPIAIYGAEHKFSVLTWLKAEPRLAGAILKAADEAKTGTRSDYARLIDEVTSVLWWMRDAGVTAPRKRLQSLIKAARAWEDDQLAIARTGSQGWSRSRSVPCPDGVHEAVLLDGPVALLEEARAMRNCLRLRLPLLREQRIRIWSVRKKVSGERVALIELVLEEERWKLREMAGKFNQPVPQWVAAFAEMLAIYENVDAESTGEMR